MYKYIKVEKKRLHVKAKKRDRHGMGEQSIQCVEVQTNVHFILQFFNINLWIFNQMRTKKYRQNRENERKL